jgi:hypothetical protein
MTIAFQTCGLSMFLDLEYFLFSSCSYPLQQTFRLLTRILVSSKN